MEAVQVMDAVARARVERPAAEVWRLVADFPRLADWHPRIAHSMTVEQRPAGGRDLVTVDGARLTEELLRSDASARVLEYGSVTHPFPVHGYLARIEVTPEGEGGRACTVRWSATYEPVEGDGEAQRALFQDEFFAPGLAALATAPLPPVPEEASSLGLEAHPEGGWFRETYRSATTTGTPAGERPTATLIEYLLAPGEQSAWHRVRHDEVWLWQHGGRLILETGGTGPAPAPGERVLLGPDAKGGGLFQHLVPAGAWQRAEPTEGRPVLVACMVTPGFDYADFELATGEEAERGTETGGEAAEGMPPSS